MRHYSPEAQSPSAKAVKRSIKFVIEPIICSTAGHTPVILQKTISDNGCMCGYTAEVAFKPLGNTFPSLASHNKVLKPKASKNIQKTIPKALFKEPNCTALIKNSNALDSKYNKDITTTKISTKATIGKTRSGTLNIFLITAAKAWLNCSATNSATTNLKKVSTDPIKPVVKPL